MDPAVGALMATVISGVLIYVVNPVIKRRLAASKENDPSLGWQIAVREVKETATNLAVRVAHLESEVDRLESEVNTKNDTIVRQDAIIHEQSRMLEARDNRIAQLEGLWRTATGDPPPSPDPALRYWLYRPVTGGNPT